MSTIIRHKGSADLNGIGGKAKNLIRLEAIGMKIPVWAVIPETVLTDQLTDNHPQELVQSELVVPGSVLNELAAFFGDKHAEKSYAVRSSAIDEDGTKHSFAGQFETYLYVPFSGLEEAIKKVWMSARSERILHYRKENNLEIRTGIAVIVQEMVDAEVSGVAFGIDPVSGNKDQMIISSVYGLGEGIVSGELDADVFEVSEKKINRKIANKTHALVRNENGKGTVINELSPDKAQLPTLNDQQLQSITALLDKLEKELHGPQDIEFAYRGEQLFLLQTRPVTAVGNEGKGEYILWDNSNIIESYPGITTPLTYTFIIKMYAFVYRQLVKLMGVRDREIEQHKDVFANTLGLVRGRVYYNLLSWYKMLAMVPGYSINAGFMETMMGVKERFELKEDYRMSKGLAWFRIIGMIFRMVWLQMRLPAERKRFMKHLNSVMDEYGALNFDKMTVKEIVAHYKRYEQSLLLEWKAPMINDFFAMIWFGVLKKKAHQLIPDEPNIHNDLLCGSRDIISVEPVHLSIAIAEEVSGDPECKAIFLNKDAEEILHLLQQGRFPQVQKLISEYIEKFGNRCVGELKLETISYQQDPTLFISVIKGYVEQDVKRFRGTVNMEKNIREQAEKKIEEAMKGRAWKRFWFRYVLNKARDHVSSRENLRYERTRGFGMVRVMFTAIGTQLYRAGHLKSATDVFYLELDEILLLGNESFNPDLAEKIEERKKEFDNYRKQADPEERFFTYGNNFTDEFIYSKEKLEPIEGDLSGIGCCPGRVQAKVRVVRDPKEISSLNGDILVTSSTDPGWVTLFPTACAIIVERGSLLSHSAIVSREMGIPCIVGVTGLLRTLKTGDEVLMDGSTGEIKILKS